MPLGFGVNFASKAILSSSFPFIFSLPSSSIPFLCFNAISTRCIYSGTVFAVLVPLVPVRLWLLKVTSDNALSDSLDQCTDPGVGDLGMSVPVLARWESDRLCSREHRSTLQKAEQ